MPPLPKPRVKQSETGAKKASAKARVPQAKASEAPGSAGREDSSIGSSTKAPPGKRTPTNAKLEEKIARFYMMMGTVMRPFGRWYPSLTDVGDTVKTFSSEAAEAWMELAEENSEVKKKLEDWTSASIYGNIIGIHFAMFMAAAPGASQAAAQMAGDDPIAFARAAGLSDEEIAVAMSMAGIDTGGPGDTVKSDRAEETLPDIDTILAQQRAQADADMNVAMNAPNGVGIVSPEQLGVIRDGQENSIPIPMSGPPRGN